jgi:predicted HNH restriction endonuclease
MATAGEMAAQTGISEQEMLTTLKFLEQRGCAKMVLVPICPNCEAMMDKYDSQVDLPDEGVCPVCGVTWSMTEGEVRAVYIITKWPD